MVKKTSSPGLVLTSEELKDRADLIAVDDNLYDLSGFAKVHPGGEVIAAGGAYDATPLFYSMHPGRDPLKSAMFQKYRVGTFKRSSEDPVYVYDSPFAKDLKKAVRTKMGGLSYYAPVGFWARTLLIMFFTLYFEYYWMTTGTFFAGVMVGIFHTQIGLSVQHDGSHGAFSSNPSVNAFFAYGADWIGSSRWIWLQQHILWHHPHTNHVDKDPDTFSASPLLVFSDFSQTKYTGKDVPTPAFKFQDYITHAVLALYGPSIVYNVLPIFKMKHNENIADCVGNGEYMTKQKPFTWFLRLFYLTRVVFAPWYFGGAPLLRALLLVNICVGVLLTFVFVVSHNFEGSDRDPSKLAELKGKDPEPQCWYRCQIETACTYGGTVGMLLTGGLNMQIEHHVFPRLSSWYYPFIQQEVRDVCKKHGVEYVYFPTLVSNVSSMLRYMRKVGLIAVLQHAREEF